MRVDRERREAILAEFDRSAMSAAAFARLHGIKYTTFNYWQKARRAKRAKADGALKLVEVEKAPSTGSTPAGSCLDIVLSCGARLEVRDEGSARLAAVLLRKL